MTPKEYESDIDRDVFMRRATLMITSRKNHLEVNRRTFDRTGEKSKNTDLDSDAFCRLSIDYPADR